MTFQSRLLAAAVFLACSLASAQNYSCVTFTLPNQGTFTFNQPISGFNKAGQVIGNQASNYSIPQGYLRNTDGTFTYLQYPGTLVSTAAGLNSAGEIVGIYVDTLNVSHIYVRHTDGSYAAVSLPPAYAADQVLGVGGLSDNGYLGVQVYDPSAGASYFYAQDLAGNLLFPAINALALNYDIPSAINTSEQLLLADPSYGGATLSGPANAMLALAFPVLDSYIFGLNNNGAVAGFWENTLISGGTHREGPDFAFVHHLNSSHYPTVVCPSYLTNGAINQTQAYALNDNNQVAGIIQTGTGAGSLGFIATTTGTAPAVKLSQTSYDFGPVPVGQSSVPATITVSNTGSGPLHIPNLTASPFVGTNTSNFQSALAAEYSITQTTCSEPVQPGDSCSISFELTPMIAGAQDASLILSDDSPTGPHLISVSGFGGSPSSVLKLSNTSWHFSPHPAGQTSGDGKIYIYNEGPYPVTTTGFTLAGTDPADFKLVATTCGATLIPYRTCSVTFNFTPLSAGGFTATIDLNDNSLNGPVMIPIYGDGKQ